jgi:hypothetical protein
VHCSRPPPQAYARRKFAADEARLARLEGSLQWEARRKDSRRKYRAEAVQAAKEKVAVYGRHPAPGVFGSTCS